ncbi:cell surface glycoprotein MUC18 isoform X1 [Pezoporus wallicus]|uniref:cell surface glycoprotein MUC18 isoform X1 n=1 Tax=Pezoporus wallicus TaxID=35540 RepID=UPI00254A9069|nr:cell surface glycoprotein MUC18 isoform X1 [Pezoporus wallicus]XP_061332002.1 cell surface glycoprotein MUC18 isoform X1 [Pezoporus flaviventris]
MAGGRRAAGLALRWGCCLLLCCAAASGLEVSMPAVVEVEAGGTARIECSFYTPENGSSTSVSWFYMDRNNRVRLCRVAGSELLEENVDYKGRLSVGEDRALAISRVTVQDARTFVCQVGEGSHVLGENHTRLHVYKVPEAPEIVASSGGASVQSSEIPEIARCVSRNSFPPPNITWHKNGEQLQPEENTVKMPSTLTRESSGLYTVSSTLFAHVTREDRHSLYHCSVHYRLRGQRRTAESRRVNITVFYPAEHVKLQVLPSSALVKEGDDVKLVCEADGNPAPVFSFFKRGLDDVWHDLSSLTDTSSGVLNLHDVNKNSSGLYRCQTLDLDDMRQLEKDVELVVNYIEGVRVKMEPSSPLREGDSVRLSCNAHSPLSLDYQWRDEKDRTVAKGNQLFLSNLTFETSRNLSCKVMAPSVPGLEQSKRVAVAVEGKPRIVSISSPLYVRQDEVVNLTCKAIAFPRPSVHWSVNGTAHEYVEDQHIASNLTVRVSHDLLRAGAMCRVSNALGVSEQHIQLLDQKIPESKGVIIVAIIVCILVVAVLGSVIYFLHKKGKIPCGRAGKQDITRPETRKDKIVVEVKSDKVSEEAGLLQGANGEKRSAADQSEKYIDLRN